MLRNIRVSCKYSIGANTLAYFSWTFSTKKKKFYDIGAGAIGSLVFEEEYKNEVFNFFFQLNIKNGRTGLLVIAPASEQEVEDSCLGLSMISVHIILE